MRKIMLFTMMWVLAPTIAWADTATVASGVKAQITTHMRYDRQCKPSGVVINVLAAPAHGTVTSEPKSIVVQATSSRGISQSSQCVGNTVEGVAVYYQSEPGFVGQDSFRYLRFNPNDAADRFNSEISYTITVKQFGGAPPHETPEMAQPPDRPHQVSPPSRSPQARQKSSGTGFFVSSNGYIITNAHVADSCMTLNAIDETTNKFPLRIIRISKSDDLALLKANISRAAIAAFRESARVNQGETVIVYGYPLAGILASGGNVSSGLVTALAGLRDDPHQIQISAPVQPGNSGGPLVDTKGAVIGVVVAKLNAIGVARLTNDIPQNINFAIKASAVTNFLDASSVKYQIESSQKELSVQSLTQKIKEYTVKIECN